MPKCKVKHNTDCFKISVKLIKGERLNNYESDLLRKKKFRGLIRIIAENKKMQADIYGAISLSEYLHSGITSFDYFNLVKQFAEIQCLLEELSFDLSNLILDINFVFINRNTRELQMIYLPILNNNSIYNTKKFFESTIDNLNLALESNYDDINKFVDYINKDSILNSDEICAFVSTIDARNKPSENVKKSPDSISQMPETIAFFEDTSKSKSPDTAAFSELYHNGMPETVAFDDEMFPETSAFVENAIVDAYITRVQTGEVIHITQDYFVIGKSRENTDYSIFNNNTISRIHAAIIRDDDCFYIIDLHSANHTFVEGVTATPDERYQLYKGSRFFLSNEEFIFSIN